MASGPDPNRYTPEDRESTQLGDPRSTRLGLSTGMIAIIAVAAALAVIALAVF